MRSWIIRNQVPFDVAWALEPAEALAYAVVFGKFEGQDFDWGRMEFFRKDRQ